MLRLKDKVGAMLVPGNKRRWDEVRDALNRTLRGWAGYFSPGSHYASDKTIESHFYYRVRNFLVRRHKMLPRRIGPFSKDAVFGELGVMRMRHGRRAGALS